MNNFLSPASKKTFNSINKGAIKRLAVEKPGQGNGKNYKSFLIVRYVPSKG